MHSLTDSQTNFIDTINQGPAALDPSLFAGGASRILLGLKAHANTISHARLVALEDSFLLTRSAMGDDAFNTLSRQFCDTAIARASDANAIGTGFADYLSGYVATDMIDLARIEWAWLESYHSADVEPLTMTDVAALGETELLNLTVTSHPAACIVVLGSPSFNLIPELGDMTNAAAVLITRPDAEVHVLALDALAAKIFASAQKGTQLCNLIEIAAEQADEAEQLAPIITLIGAGALVVSE